MAAKPKKSKKTRQDELARSAQAATQRLGELRAKHRIPDADWSEYIAHHNAIIALAQETLDEK